MSSHVHSNAKPELEPSFAQPSSRRALERIRHRVPSCPRQNETASPIHIRSCNLLLPHQHRKRTGSSSHSSRQCRCSSMCRSRRCSRTSTAGVQGQRARHRSSARRTSDAGSASMRVASLGGSLALTEHRRPRIRGAPIIANPLGITRWSRPFLSSHSDNGTASGTRRESGRSGRLPAEVRHRIARRSPAGCWRPSGIGRATRSRHWGSTSTWRRISGLTRSSGSRSWESCAMNSPA